MTGIWPWAMSQTQRKRLGQNVEERAGEWEMTAFPMISYREFDKWMEQGRIGQLVDLRAPWMFEQNRIWGSVNIPYDEIEYQMDRIRKDAAVVFYCDRGAKSMVVCRDLWRMGYQAVDLAGGMLNYRGKYIDRKPLPAIE